MNYFSKNLKYLRRLKGLTQEQFADDLKVSRSRISSYEDKRASPPLAFLIDLSEYLNISIEDLVKKKLNNLDF